MKFLTDENVALSVIRALRQASFDVRDIKEEGFYGLSDQKICQFALDEDRVIITHDKDFKAFSTHKGIVLLRFRDQKPEKVARVLLQVLELIKDKIKGNVIIVSDDKIVIHTNP